METGTKTIINEPFVGSDKDPYMYRAVAPYKATALFQSIYSDIFPSQVNIL